MDWFGFGVFVALLASPFAALTSLYSADALNAMDGTPYFVQELEGMGLEDGVVTVYFAGSPVYSAYVSWGNGEVTAFKQVEAGTAMPAGVKASVDYGTALGLMAANSFKDVRKAYCSGGISVSPAKAAEAFVNCG